MLVAKVMAPMKGERSIASSTRAATHTRAWEPWIFPADARGARWARGHTRALTARAVLAVSVKWSKQKFKDVDLDPDVRPPSPRRPAPRCQLTREL